MRLASTPTATPSAFATASKPAFASIQRSPARGFYLVQRRPTSRGCGAMSGYAALSRPTCCQLLAKSKRVGFSACTSTTRGFKSNLAVARIYPVRAALYLISKMGAHGAGRLKTPRVMPCRCRDARARAFGDKGPQGKVLNAAYAYFTRTSCLHPPRGVHSGGQFSTGLAVRLARA